MTTLVFRSLCLGALVKVTRDIPLQPYAYVSQGERGRVVTFDPNEGIMEVQLNKRHPGLDTYKNRIWVLPNDEDGWIAGSLKRDVMRECWVKGRNVAAVVLLGGAAVVTTILSSSSTQTQADANQLVVKIGEYRGQLYRFKFRRDLFDPDLVHIQDVDLVQEDVTEPAVYLDNLVKP